MEINWRQRETSYKKTQQIEDFKIKQAETKNTIAEIKKIHIKGNSNRMQKAEKWISEMEDSLVEITDEEQKRKKDWKEMEAVYENSGTTWHAPTSAL